MENKIVIDICGELIVVDYNFFDRMIIVEKKEIGETIFIKALNSSLKKFKSPIESNSIYFSVSKTKFISFERSRKLKNILS